MGRLLKQGAKMICMTCAMALALEVIFRIGAFAWHGYSEYYLFYGFHSLMGRVGINPRSTFEGGYYKFPPNYLLHGAAGQGSETALTNSHGFRGPEFEIAKPKGIRRVVCLGESSTFGYRNHDDETYPYILQKLFAQEKLPVEVINAGFPYYNTGSILSLLKDDVIKYEPDVITLYAGYNDTSWPIQIGVLGRLVLWLQDESVIYLSLRDIINEQVFDMESRIVEKLIPQKMPHEELVKDSDLVAIRYRKNVRSIVRLAKSRGIRVILIKQPVTAHSPKYASMTYEEENRAVREKFERGDPLSFIEVWMLKHYRLMRELERIAKEENLPLVDNIKIVDQDRRRLASWVHLTGEGNLRLAEALERAIKPYVRM